MVTMWKDKRFPVQGHQNSVMFLRPQLLILTNIIQPILGLVDSLCLSYLLCPAFCWGRRQSLFSMTVQWFSAMRFWSMESSVRCLETKMTKTTVSSCSPLNAECRFVHLSVFFCLFGQKKGSECSRGTNCGWPLTKPSVSLLPSHRAAAARGRVGSQLINDGLWTGRGCMRHHAGEALHPISL